MVQDRWGKKRRGATTLKSGIDRDPPSSSDQEREGVSVRQGYNTHSDSQSQWFVEVYIE